MKFLCDNCKAKYQIADEKVAGKTVRMKCRKCGHQIEVRAEVTETSVSKALPSAPGSSAREPGRPLATSLSAAKPRAPLAAQAAPSSGALAGAFQRSVQDPAHISGPLPSQPGSLELSVTDEWYVAINGVPVGPVRISELRRKAATGAVTDESLCWQEGLEEWRPVRSIPELSAIVREAAQGNRPSLLNPPTTDTRSSSPPRPLAQKPAPPARALDSSPRPGDVAREPSRPLAPARSNVLPLRANASLDEPAPNTTPLGGSAAAALAPSFTPHPAPTFSATPGPTQSAPFAAVDPFALPSPTVASAPVTGGALLTAPVAAPAPARTGGMPLWFVPVALFVVGFGGVAAYFIFKPQPPPQPVVIQMPPTPTPTAPVTDTQAAPPAAVTTAEPTPSSTPSAGPAKVAATQPKTAAPATAATAEKKGGVDMSGLLGGGGAGGPNVGPGSGPGGSAGGGLDSASVERVVASHRAGVKRTCWERGGADQKSSVNVTVTATVGPAGNVVSTASSGDDPVVGKCIETQVKTWTFGAPGSTTTVNIPFKFVRQ